MKSKDLELNLRIKIKAGSKFQHEVMIEALKSMLQAFKIFYSNTHKKNVIEVSEFNYPVDQTDFLDMEVKEGK